MLARKFSDQTRNGAALAESRSDFVLCRVCRAREPSQPDLVMGGPTEEFEGSVWYVVTCRQCARDMAATSFQELLTAVAEAERDWQLDDLIELRARHEGW